MVDIGVKSKIYEYQSKVISLEQISEKGYIQELEAPEIAESALPGHFVQIRISQSYFPFLPRPFSILNVNKDKGTILVLYKVFGESTKVLSSKGPGEFVTLLGPLGNTFKSERYKTLYLVGGGIGIPPLYYFLKHHNIAGKKVILFFGALNKSELYLMNEFNEKDIDVVYTTDDGSYGSAELITVPFKKELEGASAMTENSCIISCGPLPMLKAVQALAVEHGVSAQISVETMMACGIGLCQGCVLPRKCDAGETQTYSLVCTEGPIFSENDLVL